MNMQDLDFRQIAPRCGGRSQAFEELCCQLARRSLPEEASYRRLYGAGGDGGVECWADLPDGSRVGWQAKYVFKVDPLIRQADSSLNTALSIHSTLTRYIVCFPFDLTGPTLRRGRSGQEKFEEWRKRRKSEACAEGRDLTIEAWPASELMSLVLQLDTSGGLRFLFFNETVLTKDWFSGHIDRVKAIAGPRYTPALRVETDLHGWFAAFGGTESFVERLDERRRPCRKAYERLVAATRKTESDAFAPAWPQDLQGFAQSLLAEAEATLDSCGTLAQSDDLGQYPRCVGRLSGIVQGLEALEPRLVADLETQHADWKGRADSPGFRQFMAEYMNSFPAANLDRVRDTIKAFKDLHDWLRSPEGSLASSRSLLIAGEAGVGKTHGVCDLANRRLDDDLLTCVAFGHAFGGEPDPWTRLSELLGLPITLGRDGLLDAMDSAAEASGSPIILCIDALNETRPLQYWRNHLAEMVQTVQRRRYLRLCVTCRTAYLSHCIPDGLGIPVVEYRGFAGIERYACQRFFEYHQLKPPISPLLQPELKNPLYLRLLCETLRARGLDRLPAGWHGIASVIKAFIEHKEEQFSADHGTSVNANIVGGSLRAISRAIADSGNPALSWSYAQRVISDARPETAGLHALEWLVGCGLLMEDAPSEQSPLGKEGTVRPAFERLGDFLVAEELLARIRTGQLGQSCCPGEPLYPLVKDPETVGANVGLLGALSILLAERQSGLELPNLVHSEPIRAELLNIAITSFPWRSVETFSSASTSLVLEGLGREDLSYKTMDATLSVAWQPCSIDAMWLHNLLQRQPMAERDAWWSGYLHERYESVGPVKRLIDAAFELPLGNIEVEIAERWATILLWFTAAADRRVKSWATRAVLALLAANPEIIPGVLVRQLDCDDDEVREHTLLSSYGALIISRDTRMTHEATSIICEHFRCNPSDYDNALIRDHIRCIAELADELDGLPEGCNPQNSMQPIGSEWPLKLPSEEEVEGWKRLPRLALSCLDDDFFVYSMECLRAWQHDMPKEDMGRWVLRRVAVDFGYEGSGCEAYDAWMLSEYGGGRGKPVWAERIGKKYQWLAMYQLASRLHDHVERERDSGEPEPLRTPLILLEERRLDPTLPHNVGAMGRQADAWWIGSQADLPWGEQFSDAEWVEQERDLPSLDELLAIREHQGQRWQLLVSYPAWDNRKPDAEWTEPYRHVWTHIESFLVPKGDIVAAYDALDRRNFFGRWMPQGALWGYGFVGEYPWATSFNTEPEEWHGRGGSGHDLPVTCTPTWNQIAAEWAYDASLSANMCIHVPSREFFEPRDLWWDGRDGYRLSDGRTVFRDPRVTEGEPSSLLADADDLAERLDRIGRGIIWTLLGEKLIVGGPDGKPAPRTTFSQVARLTESGDLQIGERVLFEDYDKDVGPSTQG